MKTILRATVIKKSCVFVVQVNSCLRTRAKINVFFANRKIDVDPMHIQTDETGKMRMIFQCRIESEYINQTVHLLSRIPGVSEIGWLEPDGIVVMYEDKIKLRQGA